MVLLGIATPNVVQDRGSAVKCAAIMMPGDRLFTPGRQFHGSRGSARAAACNFLFGAGGFSDEARTRKRSRADSLARSTRSITSRAALTALLKTKLVKSAL